MKNRRSILLIIILMVVGFAAVSTTLYINGQTNINPNQDDFNVYYSDAYVNGVQDKSVITDDTHIAFTTELSKLGEKYVLDYEVANGSKNYDAELVMECTGDNEYLTVTNEFDDETILEARSTRNGTLTLELKKSNAGEDVEVTITCTISANAIERTELNENEIATNTTYVIEGNYVNENGTAIANANLVIFSDTPHYVTTDENGYMIYNGLERGEHEIYHVEDTLENIKNMTKEEIINNAKTTAIFTTYVKEDLEFTNKSKLISTNILTSETYCKSLAGTTWEYDYVNGEQILNVMCDGTYKLETWGAQGGSVNETYYGGYGAYSMGSMALVKGKTLYINIGGEGKSLANLTASSTQTVDGGYNGGGSSKGYWGNNDGWKTVQYNTSGGGATHISDESGLISELTKENLYIVSSGGGGATYFYRDSGQHCYSLGGSGGGYIGNKYTIISIGSVLSQYTSKEILATQESPGSSVYGTTNFATATFGTGGYGKMIGGGSGLYGGSNSFLGGSGGSSYIGNPNLTEKAMYCYECESSDDEDTKTISVKVASDTATANTPKKGNGYARITYLGTN